MIAWHISFNENDIKILVEQVIPCMRNTTTSDNWMEKGRNMKS
jgi:hypothetical protein